MTNWVTARVRAAMAAWAVSRVASNILASSVCGTQSHAGVTNCMDVFARPNGVTKARGYCDLTEANDGKQGNILTDLFWPFEAHSTNGHRCQH